MAKEPKPKSFSASGKPIGRPIFEPTAERRKLVFQLASFGLINEKIAIIMGCGRKTLAQRFKDELERGRAMGDAEVAKSLFNQAVGVPAQYDEDPESPTFGKLMRSELKPDKTAAIFLGKARLGLRDTDPPEPPGDKPGGNTTNIEVKVVLLRAETGFSIQRTPGDGARVIEQRRDD